MNSWIALPVALPIVGAAVSIVAGRSRRAQRAVSVSTLTIVFGFSIALVVDVDAGGSTTTQAGRWPAPLGITLVADRFASAMLVISMAMLLAVLVYAIGQGEEERRHVGFHPVYLVLSSGVAGALLTGDLFNLFVAFEVMLIASYVLLTLGGRPDQVRAGMTYVVISLVASALFLVAVAFVYNATGTVAFADLSGAVTELPDGVRRALVLLMLGVFGIKAAVFPLFFWLPDSYPTAPSAITAIFAGLLTKVGVYAIIRTQTLFGPDDGVQRALLLGVAAATMLIGVLGAIAQNDIKRILSFHIISQIGYMIFGLGLLTIAGLAGAVLYILHHIIVKTTLFLIGGLVEHRTSTGELDRIAGLLRTAPHLAVMFLLAGLSLAGIPPLSGFVAKFALVDAGLADGAGAIVAVSLVVSILTLFSMQKIWAGAFCGEPSAPVAAVSAKGRAAPSAMIIPTALLTAMSLAFAIAAGPLYAFAERTAVDLQDRDQYVASVRSS